MLMLMLMLMLIMGDSAPVWHGRQICYPIRHVSSFAHESCVFAVITRTLQSTQFAGTRMEKSFTGEKQMLEVLTLPPYQAWWKLSSLVKIYFHLAWSKTRKPISRLKTAIIPPFSLQQLQSLCSSILWHFYSKASHLSLPWNAPQPPSPSSTTILPFSPPFPSSFPFVLVQFLAWSTQLQGGHCSMYLSKLRNVFVLFAKCICPVSGLGGSDQYQFTQLQGSLLKWKAPLFIRYCCLTSLGFNVAQCYARKQGCLDTWKTFQHMKIVQ